jgi:hypothetical protein|tara:strand:- start:2077 stop:2622 length:546 start_codon:yes stop_codon:yes gene_type:complete
MKKIFAITLILTSLAFAQDESESPWSMYGGITSASFEDSDGRTTGLSLGVGYSVNDKISVGGGLSHRGGQMKLEEDTSALGDTVEIKGNALELWMSYSLIQTDSFSLSVGPTYAHIYSMKAKLGDLSITVPETDNDYGIYLGSSLPLGDKLGLNIGYYHGLKDDGDSPKFNNLFVEVGYSF